MAQNMMEKIVAFQCEGPYKVVSPSGSRMIPIWEKSRPTATVSVQGDTRQVGCPLLDYQGICTAYDRGLTPGISYNYGVVQSTRCPHAFPQTFLHK